MSNSEKVKRKYTKSDSLLLEQAQVMKANFENDLAEFTARFSHMDAAFNANWQTAIDNISAIPRDEEVVADQKQTTYNLEDTIEQAIRTHSALGNFLKVVYKENPKHVLEHFGFRSKRKARMRQSQHKERMELAYERANSAEYKPALLAKGFTQAEIDELNTVAQQLEAGNQEQEKAKTERPEMAHQRITLHNIVWEIMCEVHSASLVVYVSDYAKQQQYRLYPERKKSKKRGDALPPQE